MGDVNQSASHIITLPKGGGAVRGMGEKFSIHPQTGMGSFSVPIVVPDGRRGFQPNLALSYSTGDGNGFFGLGWTVSLPGIARKTSRGVPTYDDDKDVFILSGSEDLVQVGPTDDGGVLYRPRTEGLYARIVHFQDRDAGTDFWEVTGKDGMVSRYGGNPGNYSGEAGTAVIADPAKPTAIFAWKLTQTRDQFGNVIIYEYDTDAGEQDGHRWRQPLLRAIRYADHDVEGGEQAFFATVTFMDEARDDAFSSYAAGFEIRTSRRYTSITTAVHPGAEMRVRRYELRYDIDGFNGMSLLREVALVGFDDNGAAHRDLPPVSFAYNALQPDQRRFHPVTGPDLPPIPMSEPGYDLVDLTGDGLPDLLQCNGVVRYWRNRGDGTFDRSRPMPEAPTGISLGADGARLLDGDGDGRADLLIATGSQAGYYPLRFGPSWGRYHTYPRGVAPVLDDPQLKLVDLNADGVTDAVQSSSSLVCWFNDPDAGWTGPRRAQLPTEDPPPDMDLADPRVRWADMTGDGASDLVIIRGRDISYWPNLGHGRFGRRIRMANAPALPASYDPARLQFGDLSGDGSADLILVDANRVTVWFNQSGNGWSKPISVQGLPTAGWDIRIIDLLGTGAGGLLCSRAGVDADQPSMFFLDLTGGVKPRLLSEIDNHIGAVTTIEYVASTAFATRDHKDPAARWRTPLPFPVPVVARVRAIDEVSHSTLSSEYSYHHGYWDGHEREFRGFGRVEQTDIETGKATGSPTATVSSPPTLIRTWFHLGPVETDDERWSELDLTGEYWTGDPPLLNHQAAVQAFLDTLSDRTARRDALRVLRGRALRTEMYSSDATRFEDRPYTVTEHAYELREEPAQGPQPVFAAFEVAQRTTQWERGDDPLTRFEFTDDYDDAGQPRRRTSVAMPRRSARRTALTAAVIGAITPDPTTVLAIHERTRYAADSERIGIRDRVADVRTWQLSTPTDITETNPNDVAAVLFDQYAAARRIEETFGALSPTEVELIGHVLHHYDGAGYLGLDPGQLGHNGLLTRTEVLMGTEATLDAAYGDWRPTYLGGSTPLPDGAPPIHGEALGYRKEPASEWRVDGWYADTLCQAHDTQLSTAASPLPDRGLLLGRKDPLGHETQVTPDSYWLTPVKVRDPVGLETIIDPHYRTGQPKQVTDPNSTQHLFGYHPLGMLTATWRIGTDGHAGFENAPDSALEYDLKAFENTREPICVRTMQRVHYASDGISDEVLESWEYSDGFGRVVQQRARADELAFGNGGDDVGLLVPDPAGGSARPVPGAVGGPAVGIKTTDRVVVSGWQVYDNKGRVVRKYEPFLSTGTAYEEDTTQGRAVGMSYDPLGRLIQVLNPDGSQRRTVHGIPLDLTDPAEFDPTPWFTTGYDENDLAAISVDAAGVSLAERVPAAQHFTPTTSVQDALGRVVYRISRGTAEPTSWHMVRMQYDMRGNVLTAIDELGRTAEASAYDLLNRTLGTHSIDAGRRISVLDAAGNQRHTHDARGAQVLRTYDALNRPRDLYACDKAGWQVTLRERLTYGDADPDRDAAYAARRLGRLWTHLDEAGRVTIVNYDLAGDVTNQIREVISDESLAAAHTITDWAVDWSNMKPDLVLDPQPEHTSTRYDALGRAIELTAPANTNGVRTRLQATFDRAGALQAVSRDDDAGGDTDDVRLLVRNARGQRVFLALGNGLITRYAYDPDTFRLVRLRTERATADGDTWAGTGPPVQDLTYIYDLVGNVTGIEDRAPGCGVAGTAEGPDRLVRTFGYDGFDRLVAATGRQCATIPTPRPISDDLRCGAYAAPYTAPPAAPNQINAPELTTEYRENYTYDPTGNLLDLHHQSAGPGSGWHRRFGLGGLTPEEWADAPSNQLTSLYNGSSSITLRYDTAGNLIAEGESRQYRWDHAGRLVGFRIQAGTGTSVSARYLYGADGLRVKKWVRRNGSAALDTSTVYIGDLFERQQWSKAGGGQNTMVHTMDDATRVTISRYGPASPDDAAPAVRYELADHLGSTMVTTDATGAWINREEYLPFGETSFGSFARKRYRYSGKERDEESGIYYHNARYYSPWIGRWVSCDPTGPVDGLNLYVYVGGNPIKRTDPSGLQQEPRQKWLFEARVYWQEVIATPKTRGYGASLRKDLQTLAKTWGYSGKIDVSHEDDKPFWKMKSGESAHVRAEPSSANRSRGRTEALSKKEAKAAGLFTRVGNADPFAVGDNRNVQPPRNPFYAGLSEPTGRPPTSKWAESTANLSSGTKASSQLELPLQIPSSSALTPATAKHAGELVKKGTQMAEKKLASVLPIGGFVAELALKDENTSWGDAVLRGVGSEIGIGPFDLTTAWDVATEIGGGYQRGGWLHAPGDMVNTTTGEFQLRQGPKW